MKHIYSSERRTRAAPLLENGERLTQKEFHRRYEAYPEDVKAELIGGIVYMASPLRRPHGRSQPELNGLLWLYKNATPGVEVLDNTTTILGEESEPQPDLALRILTEFGGQSRVNKAQYVVGAPELLAEIAHSTRALDLHGKKQDYQQAGVVEYLVHCLEERELHWFNFGSGGLIAADNKGIFRSEVFPGLWIDGPALIAGKSARLIRTLKRGLASSEHAAFCKKLAASQRKKHK